MSWYSSGWAFNPYFNMYTFIPYRGAFYNPFGYALWSPFTVYDYLYSPGFYNTGYLRGGGGGGGSHISRGVTASGAHTTVAATRSGLSGTVASSGGSVRSASSASSSSVSSPVS